MYCTCLIAAVWICVVCSTSERRVATAWMSVLRSRIAADRMVVVSEATLCRSDRLTEGFGCMPGASLPSDCEFDALLGEQSPEACDASWFSERMVWNISGMFRLSFSAREAEALLFGLPMAKRCDGSPKRQIMILSLQELFA